MRVFMVRTVKIIANWKMHKSLDEACVFLKSLPSIERKTYIAPPFTALHGMNAYLKEHQIENVNIGAQNMHDAREGAFTGEISLSMLQDSGATFVILGHSERRHIFGETSQMIQKKVEAAIKGGIEVILCIGETEEERDTDKTYSVLNEQLSIALETVNSDETSLLTIAYEPVWAIGTGRTATPEQAQEVHSWIRKELLERLGQKESESISILYGGSVKPSNVQSLIQKDDIDGALVGGASLNPETYLQLIHYDQESLSQ